MPDREEALSVGLNVDEAWRLWTQNAVAILGETDLDVVHDPERRSSAWRRSGHEAGSAGFSDGGEGRTHIELRISTDDDTSTEINRRLADLVREDSMDPAVTRIDPDGALADTDPDQPL